jgi:hypothetical protein
MLINSIVSRRNGFRLGGVVLAMGFLLSSGPAMAQTDEIIPAAVRTKAQSVQAEVAGEDGNVLPASARRSMLIDAGEGNIMSAGARDSLLSQAAASGEIQPAGARKRAVQSASESMIAPASVRKIKANSAPESEYSAPGLREQKTAKE